MLDRKIDIMKRQLGEMIIAEGTGSQRVLQLSQSLDVLIVEAMMSKTSEHKQDYEAIRNVRSLKKDGSKKESAGHQLRRQHGYCMYDIIVAPIKAG